MNYKLFRCFAYTVEVTAATILPFHVLSLPPASLPLPLFLSSFHYVARVPFVFPPTHPKLIANYSEISSSLLGNYFLYFFSFMATDTFSPIVSSRSSGNYIFKFGQRTDIERGEWPFSILNTKFRKGMWKLQMVSNVNVPISQYVESVGLKEFDISVLVCGCCFLRRIWFTPYIFFF